MHPLLTSHCLGQLLASPLAHHATMQPMQNSRSHLALMSLHWPEGRNVLFRDKQAFSARVRHYCAGSA